MPNVEDLISQILEKAHGSRYSIHPGATKMYHDRREIYWWDGLKSDIAEFVAKCSNYQQVNAEHLKSGGLTQIIDVPTWKCEAINMDFFVRLPRTQRQIDSIRVILDRLTKYSHFIPVKSNYTAKDYPRVYINEIVSLHFG